MIPLLLDMGATEFIVIVFLAVLLLGPERVPDLGRKAARVYRYLRQIANTATDSIKAELGPEFADLTPSDLTPKKLVGRLIPEDMQSEMDALKAELAGMRAQVDTLRQQTADQVQDTTAQLPSSLGLPTTGRGWLGALTAPEPAATAPAEPESASEPEPSSGDQAPAS